MDRTSSSTIHVRLKSGNYAAPDISALSIVGHLPGMLLRTAWFTQTDLMINTKFGSY